MIERDLEVFLFIVFSIGMSWMVSHIFCLVYGLCGIRCSFLEADTCMLYSLVFNCSGGGWYVMCTKSVAVTWPCAHCFIRIMYFSVSRCLYVTICYSYKCMGFVC